MYEMVKKPVASLAACPRATGEELGDPARYRVTVESAIGVWPLCTRPFTCAAAPTSGDGSSSSAIDADTSARFHLVQPDMTDLLQSSSSFASKRAPAAGCGFARARAGTIA